MKPTKETAKKIIHLLSFGLVKGLGKPEPGKMCVEAAVCYAMGLPHSDQPSCVHPIVRQVKITLNDMDWSSNQARANGLQKLAIAQLGSEDIAIQIFVQSLTLSIINKIIPIALDAVIKLNPSHKESLEAAKLQCVKADNSNAAAYAARAARAAAYAADAAAATDAAADAAAYAAAYAAYAATDAAARAATDAAAYAATDAAAYAATDAAAYAAAARAAARAAAYAATDAAEKSIVKDEVFTLFADFAVQALEKAKSPGCKWLYLCDK